MTQPKRVQRRRSRGWRMPEGAVYVGRPTVWGNPYLSTDPAAAVEKYERALHATLCGVLKPEDDNRLWSRFRGPDDLRLRLYYDLRGRDLACWCPLTDDNGEPVPCHADVLLDYANGDGLA